jgi:hypothetical protein
VVVVDFEADVLLPPLLPPRSIRAPTAEAGDGCWEWRFESKVIDHSVMNQGGEQTISDMPGFFSFFCSFNK